MGHELSRMIRDGHPPGWDPPMVLVAMMIADDARDPSQGGPDGWGQSFIPVRGCWRASSNGEQVWRDGLTERTGMSERAISRALTKLGRAGFEMRVPVGEGKDGRTKFAVRGRVLNFRVPPLPLRPVPECPPSTAANPPRSSPGEQTECPPDPAECPPDLVLMPAKYDGPIPQVSP